MGEENKLHMQPLGGRGSHLFDFTASLIAEAARDEMIYHEKRLAHWESRRDFALEDVKATIGAKVVEHEVTGGKQAQVVVDHGDPEAWREYQLAYNKVFSHREAAERYRTDAALYDTQGERIYTLTATDVHHFRLGGQARED